MSFAKGEVKDLVNWYTDATGAVIAPGSVVLHLKDPAGVTTTPAVTIGTAPDAITQAASLPIIGTYYRVRVTLSQSGNWIYKWDSTGTGQAAMKDDTIVVDPSVF